MNAVALNTNTDTTTFNYEAAKDALCDKAVRVSASINKEDVRRYISRVGSGSVDSVELRMGLDGFMELAKENPETMYEQFTAMYDYTNDMLDFDFTHILETAKQQTPIDADQFYLEMTERLLDMSIDPIMVGNIVESIRAEETQQPEVYTSTVALMQADIVNLTHKYMTRAD